MPIPIPPTVPTVSATPSAPSTPAGPATKRPVKRPDIKLTAAKEESRFIGPLPLAIAFIAFLAFVGFALRFSGAVDDPNYLRARDSINVYELGRDEADRNYDGPVYEEGLASLAKVKPDSISAGPAAALIADIKLKSDLFHRRVKARSAAEDEMQRIRRERDQSLMAAQQRDLLTPQKEFPECKEEEVRGHAH